LRIPYIQQKVAKATTEELSGRLGVPVRIDKVYVQWLNRLVLDGLYLEDQHGDVLFEANHVAAGFEVLPLLKKKFVFTTIRLFGFSVNLKKETPHSPLNLQFVIDAFASQDTTQQRPDVDLRINSVLIRRGNFTYHVATEEDTPGKFNPNHVDIKNLSANISLKAFNQDSLNAHIKKMSLEEASGFTLSKLSLNVVGNRDSAYIQICSQRIDRINIQHRKIGVSLESDCTTFPYLKVPVDQLLQTKIIGPAQDVKTAIHPEIALGSILDLHTPATKSFDLISGNRIHD